MHLPSSVQSEPNAQFCALEAGAAFDGKLFLHGVARIDGQFRGYIFAQDTLIIGQGAHVEAEITASKVIIEGYLSGNIEATASIALRKTGRVIGNTITPILELEPGAIFEGHSQMLKTEKSVSVKEDTSIDFEKGPVVIELLGE